MDDTFLVQVTMGAIFALYLYFTWRSNYFSFREFIGLSLVFSLLLSTSYHLIEMEDLSTSAIETWEGGENTIQNYVYIDNGEEKQHKNIGSFLGSTLLGKETNCKVGNQINTESPLTCGDDISDSPWLDTYEVTVALTTLGLLSLAVLLFGNVQRWGKADEGDAKDGIGDHLGWFIGIIILFSHYGFANWYLSVYQNINSSLSLGQYFIFLDFITLLTSATILLLFHATYSKNNAGRNKDGSKRDPMTWRSYRWREEEW
tara:strand:+ start:22408 stop:23184 length:777 start_codon:yes stop_codon:yes gene_type:complete